MITYRANLGFDVFSGRDLGLANPSSAKALPTPSHSHGRIWKSLGFLFIGERHGSKIKQVQNSYQNGDPTMKKWIMKFNEILIILNIFISISS